ncbi:hypothetical protein ACL1G7_04620 [Corynebacterium striatum]|nr:hypothetical protein [Corynebacterium striatum]
MLFDDFAVDNLGLGWWQPCVESVGGVLGLLVGEAAWDEFVFPAVAG